MSLYDYRLGLLLAAHDYPFNVLIQAAMRKADTDNLEKLKTAFPDTWKDLEARYNAPEGRLPGDPIPKVERGSVAQR